MRTGPQESVLLVQITDLHLPEAEGSLVAGRDPDRGLREVLQALAGGLQLSPNLILATGDIADTGTRAAYVRFQRYMSALAAPVFGLPGNHDQPAVLFDVWRGHLPQWIDTPAWRIVMLDSTLAGKDAGRLGPERLSGLRTALESAPNYILVVLHHHPVPVCSPWLDRHMLQDAGALFECLEGHDRVRAVLCGHVHQEQDGWYHPAGEMQRPIRVLASPSTAFQFAPRTREYVLDAAGPAYRWLLLHPDGSLDTAVEYLGGHCADP